MEKLIFIRKIPLIFCFILLVCMPFYNQAQSIKRQCISSYGAIVNANSFTIEQTVGQPYNTTACYENKTSVLQGFQQPNVFKVEDINNENEKNLNLNVYPNPANYSITIQSEELIENSIIRITDLNGKLILFEQPALFMKHNIDCKSWENGIYIITISDTNKNESSLKLIINK